MAVSRTVRSASKHSQKSLYLSLVTYLIGSVVQKVFWR